MPGTDLPPSDAQPGPRRFRLTLRGVMLFIVIFALLTTVAIQSLRLSDARVREERLRAEMESERARAAREMELERARTELERARAEGAQFKVMQDELHMQTRMAQDALYRKRVQMAQDALSRTPTRLPIVDRPSPRGGTLMRPRFTLAGLIVATLLCGAGFAALHQPTGLIAGLTFSATAVVLGVAILGTLFSSRPVRAFCAGAAIFGTGYLVLALVPERPWLPTAVLLDWLFPKLHPTLGGEIAFWDARQGTQVRYLAFSSNGRFVANAGEATLHRDAFTASLASYRTIGHSLAGLVAAAVGGLIACVFAARRERRPEAPEG